MNYKNPFIQAEMRLIYIVFFFSIIATPVSCQDKGYTTHNEYSIDSTGKPTLLTGLKYQRISNNSSWGFKDTIGNIIIPLGKYSFLNPIDEQGMILAKKDRKEGFIDINENILIPFIYDDVGVFSKCVDLAPAVKNKKQGFINRKGEEIIPFEYDYTSDVKYFYEPGIAVLLKNEKYGVINAENKIIIPFVYSKIDFDRGNEFIIAWQEEKWVCFSTTGEQLSDFNNYEIVETEFGFLPKNSKNLPILVKIEGDKEYLSELFSDTIYSIASEKEQREMEAQGGIKYAYLDKNHNFIIPFGTYDYADVFGLGRKAIVAHKGKYGIIDERGELVLPLEYDFVERPSEYSYYAEFFVATKQDTVIIVDENINVISEAGIVSYLWSGRNDDVLLTNRENKMGLVDFKGKQTIPFLYDTLYHEWSVPQVNGYIAKKDGFYGLISRDNKIIQPFKYNYIYVLNGYAVYVDKNYKVGIFHGNGSIMIPFEYDAIYSTYYNYLKKEFPDTEDIFIVEKNGKFGTIDDKNKVIIPIIYDGLSGWVEYGPEAHFVKNSGKYGIISHKGKIIIPIEYDYVGQPQNGVIGVIKNGKYGVVSLKNKEILPCIYDNLILDIPWLEFGDDEQKPKIVVLQQNIWKYYDLNGKLLQSSVPKKEINDKYVIRFNPPKENDDSEDFFDEDIPQRWEPLGESYDLIRDIKQKGGLRIKIIEENAQNGSR